MHNKSFTVDGQATIVGGRNIADEYFGTGESALFTDLDVLAVGPAAGEAVKQFAGYWAAASAYPVKQLIAPASPRTVADVRQEWAQSRASPGADEYMQAVRRTPLVTRLLAGALEFEWAPARVLYDDPAKIREPPDKVDTHLLSRLQQALGRPQQELDLVSPYFVPGRQAVEAFQDLIANGVRIRVLTNSLASSDFAPVHAGYVRYREDLLRSGVELFEMKPHGPEVETEHVRLGSSSPSALHAKTFGVDRRRIFVGSFNLDPRSARLNTEMGLVIDSARLSTRLANVLDGPVRELAWQPRLDANGHVTWVDRSADGEQVLSSEPESGWLRRAWLSILSVLPIESLL
jgi:putative cardiolipin synthase